MRAVYEQKKGKVKAVMVHSDNTNEFILARYHLFGEWEYDAGLVYQTKEAPRLKFQSESFF